MRRDNVIAILAAAIILSLIALTFTLTSLLKAQTPELRTIVQFYSPLPGAVAGVGGRFYLSCHKYIHNRPEACCISRDIYKPSGQDKCGNSCCIHIQLYSERPY